MTHYSRCATALARVAVGSSPTVGIRGDNMSKCKGNVTTFSRVTGFYSPVQNWNKGKRAEYRDRVVYKTEGKDDKLQSDGTVRP